MIAGALLEVGLMGTVTAIGAEPPWPSETVTVKLSRVSAVGAFGAAAAYRASWVGV